MLLFIVYKPEDDEEAEGEDKDIVAERLKEDVVSSSNAS